MNTEPRPQPDHELVPAKDEPEAHDDATHLLTSDSLLRGRKGVTISHNGFVYRLQATRQGKLILTK